MLESVVKVDINICNAEPTPGIFLKFPKFSQCLLVFYDRVLVSYQSESGDVYRLDIITEVSGVFASNFIPIVILQLRYYLCNSSGDGTLCSDSNFMTACRPYILPMLNGFVYRLTVKIGRHLRACFTELQYFGGRLTPMLLRYCLPWSDTTIATVAVGRRLFTIMKVIIRLEIWPPKLRLVFAGNLLRISLQNVLQ